MAGHNLEIQIKSGNQIDSVQVSPEAVELLMPGNPQQTVAQARMAILGLLERLVETKKAAVVELFKEQNVSSST